MNKRLKRVIALALTISAFSTFSSILNITDTNFKIKPVYAASYKPSNGELSSLKIKSTNGDELDLKDAYNGDTVKLSDDKEYYTKLTDDSEGIKIDADVKGSDRVIRIFLSGDKDAKAYKTGEKLPLGKGNTAIYIRTYESSSAFRKAKDDKKDVTSCEEEYVLNVKKTTGSKYEDDSQDSIYLSNLELNKSNITFVKQRTSYDVKVSSSVDEIKITAKPEEDNYRVRIDGDLVDSSDNYRKTVSLDKGKNEIKVKVTDSSDNQRTYTLNITRGSSKDADQDAVFLRNLETDEGDIDLSEDETEYKITVDNDVDNIKVTAEPDDDEYLVKINDDQVIASDDYEKKISLNEGKNTIKITVEDEVNDKKRTYTLTVNRKESVKVENADSNNSNNNNNSSNNSNNANNNNNAGTKTDENKNGSSASSTGWFKTDKGWQFKDESGNILKNQWLFDKEQGVYCYLKEDGYRATGWFKDNGKWYLLDNKGAMLTGWQITGGKWYYLNSDGSMVTGWLKLETEVEDKTAAATQNTNNGTAVQGQQNANGQNSASSAASSNATSTTAANSTASASTQNNAAQNSGTQTNTATQGQNNSAAQNAAAKTKKITKWYYLNGDGSMATGWLNLGKWYYLNESGDMHIGWLIDNNSKYYLNESGEMLTGIQTIGGKEYKFASSGALIS